MSNTDSWALRDLRYSTVPELKRRIRDLEEWIEIFKTRIENLERRE